MNNLKIVQTEVIENRLEYALQLDRQAKQSIFQLIASLKIINDEELYKDMLYPSMKVYCQQSLNQSYTVATMYLQIAEKFGDLVLNDEVFTRKHLTMPFVKLYQLSRLPEDQLSELVHKGEVTINGSTISMEAIKTTSRENLAKTISSAIYEDAPGVKKTPKEKSLKSLTERKVAVMNSLEKLAKAIFETESEQIIAEFRPVLIAAKAIQKKYLEV